MHLNPVRGKRLGQGTPAQRRERLRNYRWSSYRGYAGVERGFGFVEPELVLGELGGPHRGERLRYRRFVEEGLLREIESPWEAVQWQAVLGSESFARQVQDRMRGLNKARLEVTALRRGENFLNLLEVVRRVAQRYRIPVERLRQRGDYGLEARNVAMRVVWEKCGMSLREMGDFFGGLNYSAVAQRLRRLSPEGQKKAARLVREM